MGRRGGQVCSDSEILGGWKFLSFPEVLLFDGVEGTGPEVVGSSVKNPSIRLWGNSLIGPLDVFIPLNQDFCSEFTRRGFCFAF